MFAVQTFQGCFVFEVRPGMVNTAFVWLVGNGVGNLDGRVVNVTHFSGFNLWQPYSL